MIAEYDFFISIDAQFTHDFLVQRYEYWGYLLESAVPANVAGRRNSFCWVKCSRKFVFRCCFV